jgi:hypothetical protein
MDADLSERVQHQLGNEVSGPTQSFSEGVSQILRAGKLGSRARSLSLSVWDRTKQSVHSHFEDLIHLIKSNDADLTEVVIPPHTIDARGLTALAYALRQNTTVRKFDCCFNDTAGDASAAAAFAALLLDNMTITELNLSETGLGQAGVSTLAASLAQPGCASVEISLAGNSCGEVGAQVLASALLANHAVRFLNVADNDIGDVGCAALAKAMAASGVEIVFSGNRVGNLGAEAIAGAMGERQLAANISCNSIGAAGAAALCIHGGTVRLTCLGTNCVPRA